MLVGSFIQNKDTIWEVLGWDALDLYYNCRNLNTGEVHQMTKEQMRELLLHSTWARTLGSLGTAKGMRSKQSKFLLTNPEPCDTIKEKKETTP